MTRQTFFCSELSRRAAEKTYGTASVGDVWLLIEYASAWGAHALEDSDLPAHVKKHLARTVRSAPRGRLLFIKQESAIEQRREAVVREGFDLFIVRTRERDPFVLKFRLESYEQLLEVNLAAFASREGNVPLELAGARGLVSRAPLFLVCTHGRRDKCCAKFGYALYKTLRERVGASIWQSSHVGGDRFAANLISFPHGHFHAHVSDEMGGRIVEEYAHGRLVVEGYRGRACYGAGVQAAEFFIRRESGLDGVDEFSLLHREQEADGGLRVRFLARTDGRLHEATVSCGESPFSNYITCHATEQRRVVQYALEDYRVVEAADKRQES
ncbi:MAG TPA: sucrase ferredoxin [Pyrinomonadaceae bacterium]|nr:sucrase ferredoxin [Pyrinomonadaceae bacterium]